LALVKRYADSQKKMVAIQAGDFCCEMVEIVFQTLTVLLQVFCLLRGNALGRRGGDRRGGREGDGSIHHPSGETTRRSL